MTTSSALLPDLPSEVKSWLESEGVDPGAIFRLPERRFYRVISAHAAEAGAIAQELEQDLACAVEEVSWLPAASGAFSFFAVPASVKLVSRFRLSRASFSLPCRDPCSTLTLPASLVPCAPHRLAPGLTARIRSTAWT